MISHREKEVYFSVCAGQIVLLAVAFCVFYFANDWIREGWQSAPAAYLQLLLVLLIALTGEAISRSDAQRVDAGRLRRRQAAALARRQSLWLAAGFGVFLTLTRDTNISRLFLMGFCVLSYPVFHFTNTSSRHWLYRIFRSGSLRLKLRTLVIGSPEWCESVQDKLREQGEFFENQPSLIVTAGESAESVMARVAEDPPDILLLPSRELPFETVNQLLALGDRRGFRCWIPVELSRLHGRRFEVQDMGGLSVLSPPSWPLANSYNRAVKRAFDIAVSAVVIPAVVLPLMALVAVIQRINSPGPLFFRQKRVGENGKVFEILKFRTMHVDNAEEARQASADDDRVYRGGRWLRRLSIDEFPQFINVLRGDMSVVGPRPHMIEHERQFEKFHELYGTRRYVKPGVTGLAQVEGYRGEIRGSRDVRGRARYDLFYVKHWCLSLDVRLVLQTLNFLIRPHAQAY